MARKQRLGLIAFDDCEGDGPPDLESDLVRRHGERDSVLGYAQAQCLGRYQQRRQVQTVVVACPQAVAEDAVEGAQGHAGLGESAGDGSGAGAPGEHLPVRLHHDGHSPLHREGCTVGGTFFPLHAVASLELHARLPQKGIGAPLVAGHRPLRTVGLYAELAEGKEQEGKDTDEREGSEDAGVLAKAVMRKTMRDKCYRRLSGMLLSQRFAANSRPLRGFRQTASFPAGGTVVAGINKICGRAPAVDPESGLDLRQPTLAR